jgi:hypothetical protein
VTLKRKPSAGTEKAQPTKSSRRNWREHAAVTLIVSLAAFSARATECSVPTSPGTEAIMSASASTTSGKLTTTISATLKPKPAGGSLNLTGFEVTGESQVGPPVLTITGLVGGPITYIIPVNNGQFPYAISFRCPLSSIANTNIVATLTSPSPGFTAALVIHGF